MLTNHVSTTRYTFAKLMARNDWNCFPMGSSFRCGCFNALNRDDSTVNTPSSFSLVGYRYFRTTSSCYFHATIVRHDIEEGKMNPNRSKEKLAAMVGHNFPDFIEHWNRDTFQKVGYGLIAISATAAIGPPVWFSIATTVSTLQPVHFVPATIVSLLTATYWRIGLRDIRQESHAIRRNYPVLGNVRYIFETIRPELRQYIVEDDLEGRPFDRNRRTHIYQRAKNIDDTIPFGTRRNVYEPHHEWACHSMWPVHIDDTNNQAALRTLVGTPDFGTKQLYSASALNISAMSYGAISDNAIIALNQGAKMGQFFHNTGEGGISQFHQQGGGDIVWNVGTGYFGCGSGIGERRIFEPDLFVETVQNTKGQVKMIELKLSQGAKPGHGGLLPQAKITREIAKARKLEYPPQGDCHSPARHSSFNNEYELIEFIMKFRTLSHGLPIGIKLCVGDPGDIARLCRAMVELKNGPDFITVDGAEGGTGAAPPELTNSVGLPLEEGLVLVRNMLLGSGLRTKVKLNASGRVTSGFSLVRTLALGADYTSAARAFMMSLGCIQALKCNTNSCPTGIATLDKDLMYGLVPELKTTRVYNFHRKTVNVAAEIVGIMGKTDLSQVNGDDIMRRVSEKEVRTLSELFPEVPDGSLLDGTAPTRLQEIWYNADGRNSGVTSSSSTRRWIF